ncbi:MAG: hypothetical protein K2M17_02670, partial [Bacilli bacterium]|nr:hypothetical protein [Bacilli bacterium]
MLPIMRRKMYAQIEKITYYHYEFLDEEKIFFGVTNKNELVEKNISLLSDEDFIAIIQSLEKEKLLKWKKKYINKFIIFVGDIWERISYFNKNIKRIIVGN